MKVTCNKCGESFDLDERDGQCPHPPLKGKKGKIDEWMCYTNMAKVRELVAEGADINAEDKVGATVLHHVACSGHSESPRVVDALLDLGADPLVILDSGSSTLDILRHNIEVTHDDVRIKCLKILEAELGSRAPTKKSGAFLRGLVERLQILGFALAAILVGVTLLWPVAAKINPQWMIAESVINPLPESADFPNPARPSDNKNTCLVPGCNRDTPYHGRNVGGCKIHIESLIIVPFEFLRVEGRTHWLGMQILRVIPFVLVIMALYVIGFGFYLFYAAIFRPDTAFDFLDKYTEDDD